MERLTMRDVDGFLVARSRSWFERPLCSLEMTGWPEANRETDRTKDKAECRFARG
jgi:hypothetical protein